MHVLLLIIIAIFLQHTANYCLSKSNDCSERDKFYYVCMGLIIYIFFALLSKHIFGNKYPIKYDFFWTLLHALTTIIIIIILYDMKISTGELVGAAVSFAGIYIIYQEQTIKEGIIGI